MYIATPRTGQVRAFTHVQITAPDEPSAPAQVMNYLGMQTLKSGLYIAERTGHLYLST